MSGKRKYTFVAVFVSAVLGVLWLLSNKEERVLSNNEPELSDSKRTEESYAANAGNLEQTQKIETISRIESAFHAPIAFYGRVIDQFGNPVVGALVGFAPVDGFLESGSYYEKTSDDQGYFAIEGLKGAGMSVGVSKDGYYGIKGKSNMTFGYGMGPDSHRRVPPTKDNPAIFELHKAGEAEPLQILSSRQVVVPPTGEPVRFNLKTGRCGSGDLLISSGHGEGTKYRFDWWFEFLIESGGLIERDSQFDFLAPEKGYLPKVRIDMVTTDDRWQRVVEADYFVKLADGTYARISLRLYPSKSRNMIVLESYLNPSGSRNLEYDPDKVVSNP